MVSYYKLLAQNINSVMGLNPCYSGQWSRTMTLRMVKYGLKVLILVVVDNGLVQEVDDNTIEIVECLNPCCSGQWSRTEKDAKKVAANFVS